jgi:hypothetical protein
MHYLSSFYFASHPLHVSGIFVAHHQEVYCIRIYNNWYVLCFSFDSLLSELGLNQANRQATKKHNTYQLLYVYGIPPDDGLKYARNM